MIEQDIPDLFDTDNVIVCQYDKVGARPSPTASAGADGRGSNLLSVVDSPQQEPLEVSP